MAMMQNLPHKIEHNRIPPSDDCRHAVEASEAAMAYHAWSTLLFCSYRANCASASHHQRTNIWQYAIIGQ
jgi:hypothetical protein